MSQKLTVLIPCKNEAVNIRDCIESARGLADEILVADSLSTDDTLKIVRELGIARIIEREFVDYANFKNWAIPQSAHPWVLILDADERVTEELAAEILVVLKRDDPAVDAYCMRRENVFLGRQIRHSGMNHTYITRLFRRDKCRYGAQRVHEHLEVAPGRLARLRGRLFHYTCRSLAHWFDKQVKYAVFWAEDHHRAGRRTNWLELFFRPASRFLHLYVFRGGCLDGTTGLIVCMSSTFYTFLKYGMLWHLNNSSEDSTFSTIRSE